MAVVDVNTSPVTLGRDLDALVVRENYTARDGGVTLDMEGFANDFIRAGHVIIRETATGELKPMPVTGDAYAALPADHTYYGHAVQTVSASKPFVGVTYHGKINPVVGTDASAQAAGYYDLTAILAALQAALPHMIYEGDNA